MESINIPAISKHLKNIHESKELSLEATISKMETVQKEGQRQLAREVEVYNLDAVIAVGCGTRLQKIDQNQGNQRDSANGANYKAVFQ